MTYTLNGIGTHLSGSREVTQKDFDSWSEHFPYVHGLTKQHVRIATKSFVLLFLPLIPLETVVYYILSENKYLEVFYPAGKDKVYWEHVKRSRVFWITPILILLIILFSLFG